MFQLKLEVTGEIGLYREGMREIKKIPRKEIKEKIEMLEFSNKEFQEDVEKMMCFIPIGRTITLKEKEIELYISASSFGSKQPYAVITGNYPLYNMLRKMMK